MSVSSWDRQLSKSKFLFDTSNVNNQIIGLIRLTPKKFKNSFTDAMIRQGIECFEILSEANAIFITEQSTDAEFKERKAIFKKARGKLNALMMTMSSLLLYLVNDNAMIPEKASAIEEDFAKKIQTIINEINGLINYGDSIQQAAKEKRKKNKIAAQQNEVISSGENSNNLNTADNISNS